MSGAVGLRSRYCKRKHAKIRACWMARLLEDGSVVEILRVKSYPGTPEMNMYLCRKVEDQLTFWRGIGGLKSVSPLEALGRADV